MKAKTLIIDTKTGKEEIKELPFIPSAPLKEKPTPDPDKLIRLIKYAESKGWI